MQIISMLVINKATSGVMVAIGIKAKGQGAKE
jgi:hypothetical protein